MFETVFSSPSYELVPVGRGPLVAWSDWSDWSPQSRARLRSWTKTGGTQVLASGPWDVVYIALSDSKIVWMGASGLQSIQGSYETAQLFWSPMATTPAGIEVHNSAVLPNTETATHRLATFGDLAATTVLYDAHADVVVANLVTGQTWSIPSRPGSHFVEVMAMNATELIVQEFSANGDVGNIERLVRLDLAKLDDLAGGPEP